MTKYYDLNFSKGNKFFSNLKKTMKLNDKDFISMKSILNQNSNHVILNYDDYKSFLLYGDVQSGKTNNLINIVYTLFEKNKIDIVIYLTGSKNDLLTQNQERFFDQFKSFNSNKYAILRNKEIDSEYIDMISKDKKIIINSLKTAYRLKQLQKLIKDHSHNKNILIIDDEADEYSLSKLSLNWTNNIINENVKFISITASPFANLYYNHKFYDYFQVLKPSIGYNGIDFFGKNTLIEKDMHNAVRKGVLIWIKNSIDNKINNTQLLINIFNMKKDHFKLRQFVIKIIDILRQNNNNIETLFKDCMNETVSNEKVKDFIKNINAENIILSNSSNSSSDIEHKGKEIIIGGTKLSRGITYKNLICEVMLNAGEKIDAGTLIQRARWLGYRNKYKECMTIIFNDKIQHAFDEIKHLIKLTKSYSIENNNFKQLVADCEYERIKV